MNPYQPVELAPSEVVSQYGESLCTGSHFLFRRIKFRAFELGLEQMMPDNDDQPDSLKSGVHTSSQSSSDAQGFRTLEYNGWWFVQRVRIDDELVWWAISWLTLERQIQFRIKSPQSDDYVDGKLEIDFGRRLQIKRFTFRASSRIVYDEIN